MRLVYKIGIALTTTQSVILQTMKQKRSHLFRLHVGFWPRGVTGRKKTGENTIL
jgi:hypothetical protein